MKHKHLKKHPFFIKLLVGAAAFSLGIAIIFVAADFIITRDRFPYNSFIEKVDVSLLDQREAYYKLMRLGPDEASQGLVTFFLGNEEYQFLPSEAGLEINVLDSIENAFISTHNRNYFADLKDRVLKNQRSLPLKYKLNEKKLRGLLYLMTQKVNTSSAEASFKLKEGGTFEIGKETIGKTLQIDETMALFKRALSENKRRFPLTLSFVKPRLTEAALIKNPPTQLVSQYTTYYGSHDSPNRIHNIKLIASFVDGMLLLPGEKFSLLEVIGDFSEERGMKEAFVIVGNELVPQFGGGTCQVATTLYNTVMLADLEILQRANHSIWFNIYPLGRDATVYPGVADFRFKNSSPYPVFIKAAATNKLLSFKIFGTPSNREVSFSHPIVKYYKNKKMVSASHAPSLAVPFSTYITKTIKDKKTGKVLAEEAVASRYRLYGDRHFVSVRRREPR